MRECVMLVVHFLRVVDWEVASGRTGFGCGSTVSGLAFHTSHNMRLAEWICRPLCDLEEIQKAEFCRN